MHIKIKGFFKDITGSMRVAKRRNRLIKEASPVNSYSDPIKDLANELHPALTHVVITKVEDVSPTARMITFEPENGDKLPPFEAGEYVSIEFQIGKTNTTRPYSICSAPYQARTGEHPYFAITVRNGRPGQGFVSSYLYANAKAGDHYIVHLPLGQFHIEPLRDTKDVVALAGGSGITPFFSMAQEIAHGTLDVNLTILYGSVSHQDIILEKQLKAIEAKCKRVKFVNVISGEGAEILPGDEKGFINRDIIRKYSVDQDPSNGKTTYFVCGPLPMYLFDQKELAALNVPYHRIRMEVFGAPRDISKEEGYPKEHINDTYKLTVVRGIHEDVIEAKASEPIAVALERAGFKSHTRCRSGACGFCRIKVLNGHEGTNYFVPHTGDGRRLADKRNDYVHACATYPLSDLKIQIAIDD